MSDDKEEITLEVDGYVVSISGTGLSINTGNTGTWIFGSGGGGGGGNAASGGNWYVPSGSGVCSSGGTIVLNPGTGVGAQLPLGGIDWAVPVEKKKEKSDGCSCKKCKEFYPYAEPNQNDGTLVCYGCRMRW